MLDRHLCYCEFSYTFVCITFTDFISSRARYGYFPDVSPNSARHHLHT